ncbi:GLIPR1-like protein 1 [Crassostrea virginica]
MKVLSILVVLFSVYFLGCRSEDRFKSMLRRQITSEAQEFLNAHNDKRRIVSPAAANMREMKWSNELATIARNFASQCAHGHNSAASSQSASFWYVGENIYRGYGSARDAVELWDSEKKYYAFSSNTCFGVCGHYTQVVWHESEYLGCARVECGTNDYNIVCNYGVGGNFNNLRPYTAGTPCSQCPSGYTCNNQLCRKP